MIYEWHLSFYFLEGVIFEATSLPLIITGYAQIFLLYLIPFIRYSDRTTCYRKAYNLSLFHFTFLFLLHDFRMIIEWRPSFACHFDIICSSSVLPSYPSMALFLLALKRVYHSCCFHPVQTRCVLRSVLDGLSAMGMCHGILSRITTLPDRHHKFSNPPSCSFSCEATSFFRCKGSMRRPFRLWATGTTPYWPMILWKSSFFFSHSVQQLPLPTKRVFAENALAHPSICITLIAPVKFDV